jgi:hypothetical protein
VRVAQLSVTAGLLVAAAGAVDAMRTATRLNRLHMRTDAAWAALDAALCHRARIVMACNAGIALRSAADAALQGGANSVREEVENELGAALAILNRRRLEPTCASRLIDAEQRVVIARRIYNDAVRDTLALRSRRMVRWLRLTGTAAAPRYFEIAEPALTSYVAELDEGAGA